MDAQERARTIVERLHEEYPDSTISLRYSDRLELLVAVVLSAQCTDKRVNKVTEDLFEQYTAPEDYAYATVDQLAEDIYGITYHNQKARYLQSACQTMIDEYDGEVPDTMADLTSLPGIGRKTANVILQHGHDIIEGIVVDTHVHRLSRRLGLTEAHTPETIERELMEIVPEEHWVQFTHLLIDHGRAVCTSQSPSCDACVLEDICPSSRCRPDTIDLASGETWDSTLTATE